MGCSSSKQGQAIVGQEAQVPRPGSPVDAASKTLLKSASGNKHKVAVAESTRLDQVAAAAKAAEKKMAKVADSKIYATAVESAIAVEVATTSTRREAWALCDAAWARALEKGKKAEKLWPSLPQLDVVKETDACQKTRQQQGAENACVSSQGELELDDIPEYPANGAAPPSSDQRIRIVMPGVGGIACDVDEDESDQAASESAVDASMELKKVMPSYVGGDGAVKEGNDTKAAGDAQKTALFPVFGFSLFAMCVPYAEEGVAEISVAHPETSAFRA